MSRINIRIAERFTEPEFSRLQALVFGNAQEYSAEFSEVLRKEAAEVPEATPAPSFSHSLRLGAYCNEELVGWSFGWPERGRIFYMANSGVLESYRRQGVYSRLIAAVCEHARSMGAVVVRSQHSVLNNPVIIAKLKFGFHVSGLSQSAQMGSLAELSYHLSAARYALLRSRAVPYTEATP